MVGIIVLWQHLRSTQPFRLSSDELTPECALDQRMLHAAEVLGHHREDGLLELLAAAERLEAVQHQGVQRGNGGRLSLDPGCGKTRGKGERE